MVRVPAKTTGERHSSTCSGACAGPKDGTHLEQVCVNVIICLESENNCIYPKNKLTRRFNI